MIDSKIFGKGMKFALFVFGIACGLIGWASIEGLIWATKWLTSFVSISFGG